MFEWIEANAILVTVIAVIVGVLVTAVIFRRRRNFGYGRRKAEPADPVEVRRQNPPD